MKDQERARRGGASRDALDHYRLLQIDPDAPQALVAEAYWYLAGKLRAELPVRRSAERELLALNTAYAALAVAEQRQAYDATVSRVMEIRRERAERARARTERPLLTRLFGTPESPQRNSYELLRIDPSAEPPLIARAYSILRTLHLREGAGEAPKEYLTELTTALTTLLDGGSRAAYDESLKAAAAARASSVPAAELGESEAGSGGGSADARKAGGLGLGRWRQRQSLREAAGRLPDERLLRDAGLLRDAAPLPAKMAPRKPDGSCLARLIVRDPAGEDEPVDLGQEPVTLGSDRECDVCLPAEPGAVAPAHAQIWFSGERFVIRSLDPLHPTILCGEQVNWASLDDGDEIEIGPYRLRFEMADGWEEFPAFLTTEHDAAASAEQIPERYE